MVGTFDATRKLCGFLAGAALAGWIGTPPAAAITPAAASQPTERGTVYLLSASADREMREGRVGADGPTVGAEAADEDLHRGHTLEERHIHESTPARYRALKNPYWEYPAALVEGRQIYLENCALCHGERGTGDGPAAAGLDPKPANFADKRMMRQVVESYWFWRISEGGGVPPFRSPMPAWKDKLTEDQIWKAVTYIHSFSHPGPHDEYEGAGRDDDEMEGQDHE